MKRRSQKSWNDPKLLSIGNQSQLKKVNRQSFSQSNEKIQFDLTKNIEETEKSLKKISEIQKKGSRNKQKEQEIEIQQPQNKYQSQDQISGVKNQIVTRNRVVQDYKKISYSYSPEKDNKKSKKKEISPPKNISQKNSKKDFIIIDDDKNDFNFQKNSFQQDSVLSKNKIQQVEDSQIQSKRQKKGKGLTFVSQNQKKNRVFSEEMDLELIDESQSVKVLSEKFIQKQKQKVCEDKKIAKKFIEQDESIVLYKQAIEQLQEYSLPVEIPCREKEKAQIYDFLSSALNTEGKANSLYISGVPGIGKTVCFLEVLESLRKEKDFVFIQINAMNISQPENVYQIICKELTGLDLGKVQACGVLQDLFVKGKLSGKWEGCLKKDFLGKTKIILLDELDFLLTSDQQLLYNLFDWPHYPKSKLIVAGIANTMNFPERLKKKIASRIGNQGRIVFNQYDFKQIQTIITKRFDEIGNNVFEKSAVEYTAKKIAFSASDIRKTLNVCRKAVQICQQKYENLTEKKFVKVSIPDIQNAYNQLYDKPYHQCLSKLPQIQKLLILAITLEIKNRTENKTAYFIDAYARTKLMHANLGLNNFPKEIEIRYVIGQMENLNLITVRDKVWLKKTQNNENKNTNTPNFDKQRFDPNQTNFYNVSDLAISLNIEIDDITNALAEDPNLNKFKHLF